MSSSALADEGCLDCHDDVHALHAAIADPDRPLDGLLVDAARFARSVHGESDCTDCHLDHEQQPHAADAETMACAECHADQEEVLANSVHAATGASVDCGTCHGVHDVLPASDRDSRLHPLNVYRVCGQCHLDVDPATASVDELLRDRYTDDAHARGILRAGLTVSATCVSCHGGHDIRAAGDPASPVNRLRVDETCGRCHVGAAEQYRQSIHHVNSDTNGQRGATCSDCHRPHAMTEADDDFRVQSIASCSRCHDQRAGSFRLTYHGKVTHLGFTGRVATCGACHGNHSILPQADPASLIHPDRRVATCARCHEGSHAEFASFLVHADPHDGERYPRIHLVYRVMNGLLIGVLLLGGLHALLWLVRALAAGDWRRPARPKDGRWIRRWPFVYRLYHLWLMGTVLLLAATGLPLHFADRPWATGLMNLLGGTVPAAWVHRTSAVALGALFMVFCLHISWRLSVRREKGMLAGPATLLPRVQDLRDFGATMRWFLFLAPRPRYGRWTYWEKFDFWAATWGLFVIGLSGLVLWFPVQATRFMPGWFVNAAVIIHGIEALLDIAFIFTVHVFHANLRPDKFPMDTMFLTGRLPEEEFRHERPLEYELALQQGRLGALAADAPSNRTRVTAYIIGSCALAVGFFFVAMMIVAVVQG